MSGLKKFGESILIALLLAGCGGGHNDAPVASSPAVVLGFVNSTNICNCGFPWGADYDGQLKRWSIPIPVKTNGDARAVTAMDAIEAKLGMVIFDRTSIENTPDGSITRGIIFSKGTAYSPPGTPPANNCGNVASAPNQGGYPATFLIPQGEISTTLYANLDSPIAGGCIASPDVVIHEFGHAMGMGPHFQGFGIGSAISPDFWSVLDTIYSNPIGTTLANILVKIAP